MGRSSHSAPGGPAKRLADLVSGPRQEPRPSGNESRPSGTEPRPFGDEPRPFEPRPFGKQPRPSGKRVRSRSLTMPDKRTALIAGGAAALILALLVAWLLQDNLGYGVTVQPQANSQPANTGRIVPTPGAGSAPGRPTTPATSKPGVGAPPSGPVSALDRQMLVKLREANLWELRAGNLASNQAGSEAVNRAGLRVVDGQTRLDAQVREAAQAVQVGIPDQATQDERTWIRKLESSKGEPFDRFFVNQLRGSYGVLFLLVAQVRATTQNSVIRDLAIGATTTITDHMRVLEDTGLVDSETLRNVAAGIR
ncbi:MAG: hypothetical protein QOD41_4454 [Cryptosporangiaceae bacterium]|nr:hypothetical protein [Cryptosporangiaceae bacterium]